MSNEFDRQPLQGATSVPPAGESEADLPMVTWLRGDEPWAGDFSMDADAVMGTLCIRRSRLTQISGKELRVGRMRIDRYIRPMYRPEDVQQYQQWSRATATHQKSSLVLKEAASRLEEQGTMIEERLKAASHEWVDKLSEDIRGAGKQTAEHLSGLLGVMNSQKLNMMEAVERIGSGWSQSLEPLVAGLAAIRSDLQGANDSHSRVEQELATFRQQLAGITDRLEDMLRNLTATLAATDKKIEQGLQTQQNSFSSLAEVLTLVIHHQKDQAAKTEASIQRQLSELKSQLIEQMERETSSSAPISQKGRDPIADSIDTLRQRYKLSRRL